MGKGANASAVPRNTLEPGENMKQLTFVRREIEKEIGREKLQFLRSSDFKMDVLLVTAYPLVSWMSTIALWKYPMSSPLFWLAATIGGWAGLSCSLVYHDVIGHRGAFGKWNSWIVGNWVTSGMPLLSTGMNTTWMARHRIHHKHTFEPNDPELFRNDLQQAIDRLKCVWGVYRASWRRKFYAKYNAEMNVKVEYPGQLGEEYATKIQIESAINIAVLLGWVVLAATGNFWPVFRVFFGSLSMFGVFDTIRWILEHGEQDMDNPFWQSTLYKTGFLSRLATTWDSGDCHTVHHIWHDVPIYRMDEAVRVINPIMQKKGVVLRENFFELIHGYLIAAYPHATYWSTMDKKSK